MIKFFKKERNFQKKKESIWLNIHIYWKLAVCSMFAVVIAAYFFGYQLFLKINKEPVSSNETESGLVQTVKKERIEKVLEYFSSREQKSNQILNSSAPVLDPSL